MQVINWLQLQPLLADVDTLNAGLQESQPVRNVCRSLVDITLHGYPWLGRSDLIPCYHPSRTYKQGQWIALPVPDPQNVRSIAWQVAQVMAAETTGNSVQGRFQALTLDVSGREVHRSGGITGAAFTEPGLSSCSTEERGWLAQWVADTYAGALLATLRKLVQKGRVQGQLAGETFLPEQLFALSVERLRPVFARLSPAQRWVSIEEILQGLPDLSHLKRETALGLVRATLKVSPYRPLGGDRWTTPELFDQLDREIPGDLPVPHIHSKVSIWTRQDKKDLAAYRRKPIPAEVKEALEELGVEAGQLSETEISPRQPPDEPLRLPDLNTLHITQACLPVCPALHAFAPDARMVFVRFIDGEYQPFLLDREDGLLKAVHPEVLQTRILEDGIPAGTHLWLAYQGNEKYSIFPQPLASIRWVPCKLASLENGKLHFEQTQIQVKIESAPAVFKADMRIDDIETLTAEARHANLSLRDALINVIQELCATDPGHKAQRSDIFNAVFLKRPCSLQSVAVLLYTQPCFERLERGCFRYKPVPNTHAINNRRQITLARLWDDLVANRIAPDPLAGERATPGVCSEPDDLLAPQIAPDGWLAFPSEIPEVETETPVLSSFSKNSDAGGMEQISFKERVGLESIHLIKQVLEQFMPPVTDEPVADQNQEDDLAMPSVIHEELEQAVYRVYAMEASPALTPAMVKVPNEPDQQPTSTIDTRRVAYGLKIPARPLHKRPFYQKILFSLGGLIHMISRGSHDQYPH